MSLSIIREQAGLLLKSPEVEHTAKKKEGCCNCKCSQIEEMASAMELRIFRALNENYNKHLRDFYSTDGDFDARLKGIVESKWANLLSNESSAQDASILDSTIQKSDTEQRLTYLEQMIEKLTPSQSDNLDIRLQAVEEKTAPIDHVKLNKVYTMIEENGLDEMRQQNRQLETQLQVVTDRNIAKELAQEELVKTSEKNNSTFRAIN